MNIELTALEARVIGCLIEKAITTPDQYPLSLNALTNACNQKSNRDPIMDLDERTVQQTLDSLARKHLVLDKSGFGSRVQKYQHRFCNTGFGSPTFSPLETAILCELLVRGPQTPGELKTRSGRMAEVNDVSEVETALLDLATREDGPYVAQLPREPGRRDARYAHLFSGDVAVAEPAADSSIPASSSVALGSPPQTERIEKLEELVAELRRELDELKSKLE
ncbi:YceH family protein [Povalibacter sp.]|uniref:YceH family protein n=1 Tax=Povalibacter sp. TaxID=1962978 RepID=UPI002F4071F1